MAKSSASNPAIKDLEKQSHGRTGVAKHQQALQVFLIKMSLREKTRKNLILFEKKSL